MDVTLTDWQNLAHKWHSEETRINAYMETTDGPRVAIRFNGCNVVAQGDRIAITTKGNQYEVCVTLLPDMTFKYSESEGEESGKSILEVRAPTWRLVLFE